MTACLAGKSFVSARICVSSIACKRLLVVELPSIKKFTYASRLLWILFYLSYAELSEKAKTLASHYPSDLDANVYPDQLVQFVKYAKIKDCCSPSSQAKLLCFNTEIEQAFSNVSVALRLFLCLMVTNCTGERFFSKLSVIKKTSCEQL